MTRKKTSTFYFQRSCTDVWNAVTSGQGAAGFTYAPISDEEYDEAERKAVQSGKTLARVTDMTPGKSCAYELKTAKFVVRWRARFETVGDNECRMVMTEIYDFYPGAAGQYLLSLLFLHQTRQHRDFRAEIERRLKAM